MGKVNIGQENILKSKGRERLKRFKHDCIRNEMMKDNRGAFCRIKEVRDLLRQYGQVIKLQAEEADKCRESVVLLADAINEFTARVDRESQTMVLRVDKKALDEWCRNMKHQINRSIVQYCLKRKDRKHK